MCEGSDTCTCHIKSDEASADNIEGDMPKMPEGGEGEQPPAM